MAGSRSGVPSLSVIKATPLIVDTKIYVRGRGDRRLQINVPEVWRRSCCLSNLAAISIQPGKRRKILSPTITQQNANPTNDKSPRERRQIQHPVAGRRPRLRTAKAL
jgi:hypothetical protein